ncbi:ABC transporter substrate-binding protein [Clostridium aminobutyricum]|uniref:ABC transporter substrate-binding protein n=1 Tax=Clostridium aminobutyricum TaxID=33953 RepID=A0A939D7L4_CLOAM|nr:ABC transporter substrate-binding protein [Clostridium aminobutyricum]MBN7772298.1 ABC transporter substrate-binding protein [Clostridium aminobutyricum]
MKLVKKLLVVSMLFILGSQLIGCGATGNEDSSDAKKDPITGETYPSQINIGIIEGGPESAILIQENYFSGIDIKVNTVTYSVGTDVNNAVVSGDVDVASFGSSPIALGIANGIDYKAVFVPYVQGGNIEALAVKNGQGISTVADLKGKTIATPFGTTAHYALLNALRLGGLNAEDVTLLDMGGQDIVAAWTRGDIDATYIWSPALDECVKDGTIITNDGELAKQGVLIPEIGVARNEFAEKYPTLVSQYVKALIDTYNLTQENPDQATQAVADWEGITKENAKGQVDDNIWVSGENQLTGDYLGTTEKKGKLAETLKTIADFHQAQGNISKAPDLKAFEDAIDPSFVELALKAK